jgi:transposase
VPSVSHLGPIHLGLDVHKDTISVAILAPDRDGSDVERIPHDEASVRRLVGRLGDPRWLRACYEVGPTGYELARLLHSMGVRCEVIAPSLIPKAPGDKVKTDRRDCRRLARLHRAGELVAIRIPTVAEEAVRDLCRARADMVEDRTRARHRLGKFLLRHGRPWRGGNAWTLTHGAGCWRNASRSRRWRRPMRTTGRCCKAATQHWRRSRPTWPTGTTYRRSLMPCTA